MKTPEHIRKDSVESPNIALQELREQISESPKDTARIEAFAGIRDQRLALVQHVRRNKDLPQKNDLQKLEARLIA